MNWDPLQKAKDSSTFCILPWVHQYIGTHGDIKPCCIYAPDSDLGNLKSSTLEEVYNNENTKKLRLDMLNNVVRPECKECNLKENVLQDTYRSLRNKHYFNTGNSSHAEVMSQLKSTQPDGTVPEHKLYFVDSRWNNLCNFKCMTCSPLFSSSLITEYEDLYNIKHTYSFAGKTEEDAFEQIVSHIPTIESIYFAGGEPMMQKQHYMLLDACISANKFPGISYNTNLSRLELGSYNVIELWKKFDNVSVMASLDGNHQRAEYWRKGTDWSVILANRYKIKEQVPHVRFVISCTVSWPNVFNILDFHKEWYNLGLVAIDEFRLNPIFGPEMYSLVNLPQWKKDKVVAAIHDHINWISALDCDKNLLQKPLNDFLGLCNFINMNSNGLDLNRFHTTIRSFDAYRKSNFFDVFPEHADMEQWFNEQGYFFPKNLS